jgi:hypothetical protein
MKTIFKEKNAMKNYIKTAGILTLAFIIAGDLKAEDKKSISKDHPHSKVETEKKSHQEEEVSNRGNEMIGSFILSQLEYMSEDEKKQFNALMIRGLYRLFQIQGVMADEETVHQTKEVSREAKDEAIQIAGQIFLWSHRYMRAEERELLGGLLQNATERWKIEQDQKESRKQ